MMKELGQTQHIGHEDRVKLEDKDSRTQLFQWRMSSGDARLLGIEEICQCRLCQGNII